MTLPLAPAIYESADIWVGDGREALFLCPAINDNGYYAGIYAEIKRVFGDLPHQIFGRQFGEITDPAVLPYLSDAELNDLYARAPVFVYPSAEPRHVALLPARGHGHRDAGRLPARHVARQDRRKRHAPARCAGDVELYALAQRLMGGDRALAERIRSSQARILEAFSDDRARRQWQALLDGFGA